MDSSSSSVSRPPASSVPTWATYTRAIGPKLRILLALIFILVALLGATGAYLSTITFLNWYQNPQTYTSPFTLWMFLGHSVIGVVAVLPFLIFGLFHMISSRNRPNRTAVRLGMIMFGAGILVCLTGLALIQISGMPQLPSGSKRDVIYALHIVLPLLAVWLYVMHRRAGPDINWKWGFSWLGGTALFIGATAIFHGMDPRSWNTVGPKDGAQYFHPSDARTADGNFISADVLMADEYCMKCHQDVYKDHLHSAHKFSSGNNPAYLFSVNETREVGMKRDGNVKASRWCAGCHDPVPFFSGQFSDPEYSLEKHPTGHAGITCTVCHAMTHVNSTIGNGAYTIEEPQHYPFAFSTNDSLQWLNNQLVKAKPDFHKKTFLKPFHKSEEFCSTCHKVSLPVALNNYKDFLRGQNHYDSFLLSGVSGHGARAFYDPPVAKENCASCHMPLKESNDFGSKDFDGSGVRKRHDHFFPAANTGLFELLKKHDLYKDRSKELEESIRKNTEYLVGTAADGSDKKLRIDIFGIKTGGADSDQVTLIRPKLPKLTPGKSYVLEVVVRTLNVGHHFSQGTVDSNEIWVDFKATQAGKEIARNGALKKPGTDTDSGDDTGELDKWAHMINVWMLDRDGNRIDRRNPQDIFTPLYDHQVPPGAANVVHYRLDVPKDSTETIELTATLRYRKFDYKYMQYVHKGQAIPKLPIVDVCSDKVILPVDGGPDAPAQESPVKPAWQRWNDYGIACYIEAGVGQKRGQTKQAEAAFKTMLTLDAKDAVPHAHVNLSRILIDEGRYDEATVALNAAKNSDPPAAWWKLAWFNALVNSETGKDLDLAIESLKKIVDPANKDTKGNRDFGRDYVVWNKLAELQFRKSIAELGSSQRAGLLEAMESTRKVLDLESESVEAHDRMWQILKAIGKKLPDDAATPEANGDSLLAVAARIADKKLTKDQRIKACAEFTKGVEAFLQVKGDVFPPRLPSIRELIAKMTPTLTNETDSETQSYVASALASLHLASVKIYKIDEVARSNAANRFREKPGNEAANYASRDRVVYPTTVPQRAAIVKTGNLP